MRHGGRRRRSLVRYSGNLPVRFREFQKSPALAAALSIFFPGLGQFYNGHFGKGLFFFVTSWLILPYFIGIGDAYFSARRISDRHNRNLFQHLLDVIDENQYQSEYHLNAPVDAPPPMTRYSPQASESTALTRDEEKEMQWEKRMITGGALAGMGALFQFLPLIIGGGRIFPMLGLLPLVIGGVLFFLSRKKQKEYKQLREKAQEKEIEKSVVLLASKKGGLISVADLVAGTDLGMEEAEELLNRFVVKGYADIEVSDSGLMLYRFSIH